MSAPTAESDASQILSVNGTDLITTYGDGEIAAYSPGDIAWILTCTCLVFLMIPGLGYLYSGLARRKNALHMLLMTMMAFTVVSIQWVLFGYVSGTSLVNSAHLWTHY